MTNDKPVALVTGAHRGLGLETSRQLGKRGVKVLIGARDLAKGEQATETLRNEGIDAEVIQLDVSDTASITAAIAAISKDYGRLDILVNNAAVLNDIGQQPSEVSELTLRQNLDVNFIDELTSNEIEETIDSLESRIKAALPVVNRIYIEAETLLMRRKVVSAGDA